MTTIIVDDEVHWDQPPVPPGFVPPTIRQTEAEFFVCEGKPFVVWPMMGSLGAGKWQARGKMEKRHRRHESLRGWRDAVRLRARGRTERV
jgi:hypothetical protein